MYYSWTTVTPYSSVRFSLRPLLRHISVYVLLLDHCSFTFKCNILLMGHCGMWSMIELICLILWSVTVALK